MTSFYRANLATMKLLAVLAIPLFAVGTYAASGSFWCIATRGGHCVLPGVGPTYACGEANGGAGYESGANKKFWRYVDSLEAFENCCHASNKGGCYDLL
jgi:hypothetical protein